MNPWLPILLGGGAVAASLVFASSPPVVPPPVPAYAPPGWPPPPPYTPPPPLDPSQWVYLERALKTPLSDVSLQMKQKTTAGLSVVGSPYAPAVIDWGATAALKKERQDTVLYYKTFGYLPVMRGSDLVRAILNKQTSILSSSAKIPPPQQGALRDAALQGAKNASALILLDTQDSIDFFANLLLGTMLLFDTPAGRNSPLFLQLMGIFRLHRWEMDREGAAWKQTLLMANRLACGGVYSYITKPAEEALYAREFLDSRMRPWKEVSGLNTQRPVGYGAGFSASESRACSLYAIEKANGRWKEEGWQTRPMLSERWEEILGDGLLCLLEHAIPRYTNTVLLSSRSSATAGQIAGGLVAGGAKSLSSFLQGDLVSGATTLILSGIQAAFQVAGQFDKDKELRLKANQSVETFMRSALGMQPRADRVPSIHYTMPDGTKKTFSWPLSSVTTWLSGFQLPLLIPPERPFDAVNHWDVSTPVFFHYGALKGFTWPHEPFFNLPMLVAQPAFLYRQIAHKMLFGTGGISDMWFLEPTTFTDSLGLQINGFAMGILSNDDLAKSNIGAFVST